MRKGQTRREPERALPDMLDVLTRESAENFCWAAESTRPWVASLTRISLGQQADDPISRERLTRQLSAFLSKECGAERPFRYRETLAGLLMPIACEKYPSAEGVAAALAMISVDSPRPINPLRHQVPCHERFTKKAEERAKRLLGLRSWEPAWKHALRKLWQMRPPQGTCSETLDKYIEALKPFEGVILDGMYLASLEAWAGLESDLIAPVCPDGKLRLAARLLRSTLCDSRNSPFSLLLRLLGKTAKPLEIPEQADIRLRIAREMRSYAEPHGAAVRRRTAALALLLADGLTTFADANWTRIFEEVTRDHRQPARLCELARAHVLGLAEPIDARRLREIADLAEGPDIAPARSGVSGASSATPGEPGPKILDTLAIRGDLERMKGLVENASRNPGLMKPAFPSGSPGEQASGPLVASKKFAPGDHLATCTRPKGCIALVGWTKIRARVQETFKFAPCAKTMIRRSDKSEKDAGGTPLDWKKNRPMVFPCALLAWFRSEWKQD